MTFLSSSPSAGRVTAILGPTNTGKTHMAIEQMVAHSSGIIGLPLRLLAREVYQKLCGRVSKHHVALITGEEKIIPEHPLYWVATMEAMPQDLNVAFVALDEVQLAINLERGHIFTDRLLNMRGRETTLLLGSMSLKNVLQTLIPDLSIVTRPRLSQLHYVGAKKITRLPPRSAIVAFSASDVYAIAELVRRQKGGAALVMGALSPRTRNAQVALYQSGDVDYLIATDAIGMGLNLDVDHVAFAGDRKFDGFQYRALNKAEIGQIAGRAGRHLKDGTFGVTGAVEPFDHDLVAALESYHLPDIKALQWRNPDLNFHSLHLFRQSLDAVPSHKGLLKALPQDDVQAFDAVLCHEDILQAAKGSAQNLRLLWDVCRIPDYRKTTPAHHGELISTLYRFLIQEGRILEDWFAKQMRYVSSLEGGIDTLSARIAHIRTWTYIAHKNEWIDDSRHWQKETQHIENALSDALHEQLMRKFVNRRTSVLMRRLRQNDDLDTDITQKGDVIVAGQHVGSLSGFRFSPDQYAIGKDAKAVRHAAAKALGSAYMEKAQDVLKSQPSDFVLTQDYLIRWKGTPVARFIKGDAFYKPTLILLADEQLDGDLRQQVQAFLEQWFENYKISHLGPLLVLGDTPLLEGVAKGLCYRLFENYGVLDKLEVLEEVRGLDQDTRAVMRRLGIRFGAYHLFMPLLLKPAASTLLLQLWALFHEQTEAEGIEVLPALCLSGRTSLEVNPEFPIILYKLAGFKLFKKRAVRVDILERLADLIRPLIAFNPDHLKEEDAEKTPIPEGAGAGRNFMITGQMTSLLGCAGDDFKEILRDLGYQSKRVKPYDFMQKEAQGLASKSQKNDPVSLDKEAQKPSGKDPLNDTQTTQKEPNTKDVLQEDHQKSSHETNDLTLLTSVSEKAGGENEDDGLIEIWFFNRQHKHQKHPKTKKHSGKKNFAHKKAEYRDDLKRSKKRLQRSSTHFEKKEKKVDPDSPFAALAALKREL